MRINYKLLLGLVFSALNYNSFAQTTIYSEDFNAGSGTMVLNSTDQSSTATGFNLWIVNNVYAGGSVTINCLGFPFTAAVGNTDPQPAGITSPNGGYMHILSTDAQTGGVNNANFRPADGLCAFDENYFSKTATISTLGYTGVSFSFWWLCAGGTASYGEVYYSTDGGSSWTQSTSTAQYTGQSTWIQETITNAAFDNQTSIMFGFRFVNGTASAASDPAFGIDDIKVTGAPATEITEITSNASISIYPNPVTNNCFLNLEGFGSLNEVLTIKVINELGQLVLDMNQVYTGQLQLNTSQLREGVYSVIVNSASKQALARLVK
jgi:hypothetical protein